MTDVIIIGGGPAGMGAALNLLRAGRSVLILEHNSFGGQMATSPRLENIPGIKEISGLDYADQLFSQITDLGAEFEIEEATKIEKKDNKFVVTTNYHQYECYSVVIATGVSHRKVGVKGEEELIGKGISYCATCDGAFYAGKETYVIGDANSALQYALLLNNYCSKVHIKALFSKLFGDQVLIDRIEKEPNIDVEYNVSLQEFVGEDELKALRFINTQTNKEIIYETNNCFVAIGQIPHNENFKDIVELDKNGFIITNDSMETSCKGIFAIGDTRKKDVRQVITALSDGSVASVFIDRYIREINK